MELDVHLWKKEWRAIVLQKQNIGWGRGLTVLPLEREVGKSHLAKLMDDWILATLYHFVYSNVV